MSTLTETSLQLTLDHAPAATECTREVNGRSDSDGTTPRAALDRRDDADDHGVIADLAHERLVSRAIDGDRDAVAEIWQSNRRWIASVVAAHATRASDLDDVLQEVASILITKVRQVRDAGSLRGWLRMVAINAARMRGRSVSSERKSWQRLAQESGSRSSDIAGRVHCGREDSHARAIEARETLALVARLPAIYAEPLLLQAGQGMSQRAIAHMLDVPETTIETRLARGRRMLRTLAQEQLESEHTASTRSPLTQ